LNAVSSDGFSPLGLASFFGHADTVKLLLDRGADTKGAAALAATKGRLDVLKLLQEQGR